MPHTPQLRRLRLSVAAVFSALLLVGVMAAPAHADFETVWTYDGVDLDVDIAVQSDGGSIYRVEVTNNTDQVQFVGLGVDLHAQGVTEFLWQQDWQVFQDFGRAEVAPGETVSQDLLPAWSGMHYSFYSEADTEDPVLLDGFDVPGYYLPFNLTGGENGEVPATWGAGWSPAVTPAVARAGDGVYVEAPVGAEWPLASAQVWIAASTDDSATLESLLLRGLAEGLDSTGITPVTEYFDQIGTIDAADGIASGNVTLPAGLEPGVYGLIVGDPDIGFWPAGPTYDVNASLMLPDVTIEPGPPHGTTDADHLVVTPLDQYGRTPVTFTFEGVNTSGITSVTSSAAGPTPTLFAPLGGANGVYYELNTTADVVGEVEVCISYDASLLSPEELAELALYHYEDPDWVNITTDNETPGVICGVAPSLSPFAIGIPLLEFSQASVPTITGTKTVGATLAANRRTWDPILAAPDFRYQWNREGTPIADATAPSYTLTQADAGSHISVTVTGVKSGYVTRSEVSAATGYITGGIWAATSASVTGVPAVGQYLYADASGWSPSPTTLRYQWYRASDGTTTAPSSSNRYTVRQIDAGSWVRVIVTASKPGFTTTTAPGGTTTIEGALTTATPTITGSPLAVGSTLTAVPGAWGPSGVSLSYQWLRNGEVIDGATNDQYTLVADDAGQKILVRVTGSLPGYTAASKASAARTILKQLSPAPIPEVTGSPAVGQTLSVDSGAWGPGAVTLRYQWYRGGVAIGGPRSANTYKLAVADAGQELTVRVTGSQSGYSPVTSASSNGVAIEKLLVTSTPTIAGSPLAVGTTLTAVAPWGPESPTLTYQWNRNAEPIADAEGVDYILTNADAGKSITVTVTGSQAGYTPVTRTSGAKAINSIFTTVPKPTVSGTPVINQTLTAVPGAWHPAPTSYSYQWQRDGVTVGTASTYKVKTADRGHVITLVVSGSKAGFTRATSVPSDGLTVP